MNPSSYAEKHFKSAESRFFESVFNRFLQYHLPQVGGPELRRLITHKAIELIEKYMPKVERIKPGQMLWTAVSKHTRADSKKVEYKPVVLTLVNSEEIKQLVDGTESVAALIPQTLARILKEASEQGALLSMRDLALIYKRTGANICFLRQKYEKQNGEILPTPAVLQDMGSGITHKTMILRKILIEKKDMKQIRDETKHTQQAIDRYLKDYRRVEMLLDDGKDCNYIARVTSMSKFLIKQYILIYNEAKYILEPC